MSVGLLWFCPSIMRILDGMFDTCQFNIDGWVMFNCEIIGAYGFQYMLFYLGRKYGLRCSSSAEGLVILKWLDCMNDTMDL